VGEVHVPFIFKYNSENALKSVDFYSSPLCKCCTSYGNSVRTDGRTFHTLCLVARPIIGASLFKTITIIYAIMLIHSKSHMLRNV